MAEFRRAVLGSLILALSGSISADANQLSFLKKRREQNQPQSPLTYEQAVSQSITNHYAKVLGNNGGEKGVSFLDLGKFDSPCTGGKSSKEACMNVSGMECMWIEFSSGEPSLCMPCMSGPAKLPCPPIDSVFALKKVREENLELKILIGLAEFQSEIRINVTGQSNQLKSLSTENPILPRYLVPKASFRNSYSSELLRSIQTLTSGKRLPNEVCPPGDYYQG
jgi:hypothetical protein